MSGRGRYVRAATALLRARQKTDQRGCGAHLHLLHDPTAMDLDGFLGRTQLGRDLLVEHSRCHELEDLPLTRGETCEAADEIIALALLRTYLRIPEDRLLHGCDELRALYGLGQKAHRAGLHRPHRRRDVALSGDEDDRPIAATLEQRALQLEPAHSRHAHVGDEAAWLVRIVRLQEFERRGPAAHGKATRLQHTRECGDHALLIVHQEDDWLRLRHT